MATEPPAPFDIPALEDCFVPAERCWCGWTTHTASQYSPRYHCCARCGTHYASRRIRPEAVERFYGFERYWRDRNQRKQHEAFEDRAALFSGQGRLAKWLQVIARHHRGAPGFAFEIGCAEGSLLTALHQGGWRVTGLEPDAATAAAAHSLTGLDVRAGAFPCPLDLPPADVVVALDVLEHAADPLAFLVAARRLLQPGGFLFLQTPLLGTDPAGFGELNNRAFDPQEHAFLFTRDSVADLLASAGFNVVENSDAWSIAHEIVVARPLPASPLSPRPLINLPEMFSVPFAAIAEELVALAMVHGLASHVRSPRAWEYPWLWLNGLAAQSWHGRRVVDLGSEISPWPWWLATHGARVTLVEVRRDWEPLWVRLRATLGVEVDWVFAVDDTIPLPDACADVVTSVSVLEHQQDRPRAIAELVRVLRPGGMLGLTADICEPGLGMVYPEWNGTAMGAVDFEDLVWHNTALGLPSPPVWNWGDVRSFLAWFARTAPHHNYTIAAALLEKSQTPGALVAPPSLTPAILVAQPGDPAGVWAAAPWLACWSRQEPARRFFWVVPASEITGLCEWLPATQIPFCDFSAAPRVVARQIAAVARPGLVLLGSPLDPRAPWDAASYTRLVWWSDFLAELSWDLALIPAGTPDWLAAFTIVSSQAPRRCGPKLSMETMALLRSTPVVRAHEGPVFTEETVPAIFVAAELAAQFAGFAPHLSLEAPSSSVVAASGPVLLLPGTATPVWPAARWSELATLLSSQGVLVDLLPAAADPRPSLARLRSAAVVVGSDAVLAQIAALVDVPAVIVAGGTEERRWRPTAGRVKFVQGLPACRGCGGACFLDRPICIESIPVQVVADAILTLRSTGNTSSVELDPPLPPGVLPERLHVLACQQLRRSEGERVAAQHTVTELAGQLTEIERVVAALRRESHGLAERHYVTEEESSQRLRHIYELEQRLAQNESDGARRLQHIYELEQRLAQNETDRALRLRHIYELEQRLAQREADGEVRLQHIHELERLLAVNDADREARLQHIHRLEARLLGSHESGAPDHSS